MARKKNRSKNKVDERPGKAQGMYVTPAGVPKPKGVGVVLKDRGTAPKTDGDNRPERVWVF